MNRYEWLLSAGAVTLGSAVPSAVRAAGGKPILIAEPVHSLGYLPLYVAIQKGYFTGLDVTTITLPSSGAEHTNAVLSGRAWGFIGGPEHNAYADVKGAHLRAICNVVNRGNVYFVAVKGQTPGSDMKAFFRGKKIATSGYGGTPNSIARYLIKKVGLDPQKDVELVEVATPAIPSVLAQGRAEIGVMDEPMISKGIEQGIWGQPFYAAPRVLGAYAYSTVNVTQASIDGDPATVRTFVGGMLKALALVRDRKDEALAAASKEYPDLTPSILHAAFERAYGDQIWEYSGRITPAAVRTAEDVVKFAGLLTQDVPYDEIVEPQFVAALARGR